jgi:hypothetical protein
MDIKAIETVYNGYRFRSRLEARWAVFFDAMSIKYEYEPEGFELGDGYRYLPDFYLPDNDVWVEIKGKQLTIEERIKTELFCSAKCDFANGGARFRLLEGEIPKEPLAFAGIPGIYAYMYVSRDELTKAMTKLEGKCPEKPKTGVLMGGIWAQDNLANWNPERLKAALSIARQARFEHGETPTPESIREMMEHA